jgi:glycosyltransferase involved in cell wall biosynthesis
MLRGEIEEKKFPNSHSGNGFISCIIPFYNEEKRIFSVLEAMSRTKDISEIICVDDGSTDNTFALVKKNFPLIKLIKLEKNKGKSTAVQRGLSVVKTKYVFLVDSDLKDFNIEKIEDAMNIIKSDGSIDMLIFKILATPDWILALVRFFRGDVLASGQRILKTKDLKNVFSSIRPENYQLEVAINEYMMANNKNCFWLEGVCSNPHKSEKTNLRGWVDDLSVVLLLLKYLGVLNWLKQYFLFCKSEYNIDRKFKGLRD